MFNTATILGLTVVHISNEVVFFFFPNTFDLQLVESVEAQPVDTEGQLYDSGIMPKALGYSLLSGIQMLFWLWLFAYVTLTIASQLPSSLSAPPPWLSYVCDSGIW